jgi:hypothetical protein
VFQAGRNTQTACGWARQGVLHALAAGADAMWWCSSVTCVSWVKPCIARVRRCSTAGAVQHSRGAARAGLQRRLLLAQQGLRLVEPQPRCHNELHVGQPHVRHCRLQHLQLHQHSIRLFVQAGDEFECSAEHAHHKRLSQQLLLQHPLLCPFCVPHRVTELLTHSVHITGL